MNQRDIDRLLDNVDGFLPSVEDALNERRVSVLSSPPVFSCEDGDSDQDDQFEDTLDGVEDMEDSPDHHHVDVHVVKAPSTSDPSSLDSGVYQSSPDSLAAPPSGPRFHHRRLGPNVMEEEDEEDEILIVSSCQRLSCSPPSPMNPVVDSLAGELEHLRARVTSLETILSLRREVVEGQGWWPLQTVAPR